MTIRWFLPLPISKFLLFPKKRGKKKKGKSVQYSSTKEKRESMTKERGKVRKGKET